MPVQVASKIEDLIENEHKYLIKGDWEKLETSFFHHSDKGM